MGGLLIQSYWCPYKRRSGHTHAQRVNPVRTQGEDCVCKLRNGLGRDQSCTTLTSDLKTERNKHLLRCCPGSSSTRVQTRLRRSNLSCVPHRVAGWGVVQAHCSKGRGRMQRHGAVPPWGKYLLNQGPGVQRRWGLSRLGSKQHGKGQERLEGMGVRDRRQQGTSSKTWTLNLGSGWGSRGPAGRNKLGRQSPATLWV
jgi:hypothetical protein